MKRSYSRFLFLSLSVILSLFLVSCGEETTPVVEQPTPEQQQQPAQDAQPTVEAQPTTDAQLPAAQAGVVDTGFRPEVDGFAYQNYGDVAKLDRLCHQ